MYEEMRPKNYLDIEHGIFDDDDTPCMDCPNRDGGYCRFYEIELDERDPGVYVPCDKCDVDAGEDDDCY